MPKNQYIYSVGELKNIANNYNHTNLGIPMEQGIEVIRHKIYHHTNINLLSIAEYRVDFDRALNSIGKGHWIGEVEEFKYYHNFGRLQKIVIADIIGIEDLELEEMRFYQIPQLRGRAYHRMAECLNGHTYRIQFIAKPLDKDIDN